MQALVLNPRELKSRLVSMMRSRFPVRLSAQEDDADGGLALENARPELKKPPLYKVVLLNDDYTPMEFVVMLLEKVFEKSPSAASQLMLQIHRSGHGVGGVFVLEVAETKVSTVHKLAEDRGYPLRAGIEEE